MPILEYPEDRKPIGRFGGVDYTPQPDAATEIDPDTLTVIGSAFRQDNTIGSTISNKMAGIDRTSREDGFTGDVMWNELQGTRYEQHWPRFAEVHNRVAFNALKSQIDMEDEDRRILHASGWAGMAASFGAAAFDVPSLLPGGAIVRGATLGGAAVRTGLEAAAAGALGAGVSEIALQTSQETRPVTESVIGVGAGAVLGGLLGAGTGALFTAAERRAALKTVQDVMTKPADPNAFAEFRAGALESAGAAATDKPVLSDFDIGKGARAVGKAQASLNPLLRAAQSPSAEHRLNMADLAETGYYLARNARGEGNIAVESAVKQWDRGAYSAALKGSRAAYDEARKSALNITREDFRTAVSKAMRRGDESDVPGAAEAASVWRSTLFDPLKERAIEVGLLPPDVSVKTAVSYLTRFWNSKVLTAEEGRFKDIVRPWINDQLSELEFKADEIRIGNKIVDSDKAMENYEKAIASVENVENRLAERSGSRQRRSDALGEMQRTRQDMLKARAPKPLVDMLRGADENAVMIDAVKQARQAAKSAGKKQSFAERSPVLALIRKKGGVRVGSKLDYELRSMDVTPKSHPGLFHQGKGLGDVDNFVKSEDDIFADLPDDGAGYVDGNALMDAIRSELSGVPLRSQGELAAAQALDEIEKVAAEWLDRVGLDGNATVKEVRDFIGRVIAGERNVDGIDTRISRFERELAEFDEASDKIINERDIRKTEMDDARQHLEKLESELDQVGDLANASPRVRLVVDYATTKRELFKAKLAERPLAKRVTALRRMETEGRANDAMLAELNAKSIDLDRLRANIEGLRLKADKLQPMVPKVRQELPDFVSDADREDYVNEIVNDVFDQLTSRARMGMPSYDVTMSTRGPMKERTFNIPDHLIEDFLENDIELIGRRYARVMATDVELARMDKRRGGTGSPTLKGAIDRVRSDYLAMREAVIASDKSPVEKSKALLALKNREASDVEDIAGVRDLLRGQYAMDSQHTNFARVLRVVQAFNYMRSLGGVLAASVTDAARPAMVHGFRRYMGEGIAPLATNLKAVKLAREDAELAGAVTERLLQSRVATMAELSDPHSSLSPFERFIDNASNVFSKMTFLPFWNDMHKSVASVLSQNRIIKNVLAAGPDNPDYGALDAAERKYMGYLGIDEQMAARVARQFAEHGQVEGNVHIPGLANWTDKEALRAFTAALNKDVDSVIVTKSVADVPLFAHTPVGRALIQFRSFALASNQRVLMRGLQEGPRRFIQGVLGMAVLGMAAYWFKSAESGRVDENLIPSTNPGNWIMEGLDRSSIFPLAFEINNTWEKLGAPGFYAVASRFGKAIKPDADVRSPASRYVNRDAFGALLGPSFQLGTDAAQLLGIPLAALRAATDGDDSTQPQLKPADVDRISRMIPFLTLPYWRWAIEGGFDFDDYGVKPQLKSRLEN